MSTALAASALALLLGGRLYAARRALGGRSTLFLNRTTEQVGALSEQVGVPLDKFLTLAQRLLLPATAPTFLSASGMRNRSPPRHRLRMKATGSRRNSRVLASWPPLNVAAGRLRSDWLFGSCS